ncbi:hypothetical protein [Sinorhizobium sp. FG01]|nr:hypothetical protein [Sinorhizobium sp. FG01]
MPRKAKTERRKGTSDKRNRIAREPAPAIPEEPPAPALTPEPTTGKAKQNRRVAPAATKPSAGRSAAKPAKRPRKGMGPLARRIEKAQKQLDNAAQRLREIDNGLALTVPGVQDEGPDKAPPPPRGRRRRGATVEGLEASHRQARAVITETPAAVAEKTSADRPGERKAEGAVAAAAVADRTDEIRASVYELVTELARTPPAVELAVAGGATERRALEAVSRTADVVEKAYVAVALALLAAAILLWKLSLPTIDPNRMTDLGLVSILPPAFYLSLVLLCTGFAWQVAYRCVNSVLPYLYLVALIFILHATPPILYQTLRYSWAWKHLGIVDYIQRHGTVDPAASFLSAYHNWPGLFVVTAWIADLFDARPIDLASVLQFTPVALNIALLAVFLWLLESFTEDKRLLLTAGWFFVAANWIGQDYFSPQGITFLLYLVLLGLFLGPLRQNGSKVARRHPRLLKSLGPAAFSVGLKSKEVGQLPCALFAALAMVTILAIAVTHQLTPLVVILSAIMLVMLGWIAPSYLVFALVAETLWLLWGAAPFVYSQLQSQIASFWELSEATSKFANLALVSPDRAWVVWVGRVFSTMIVLVALYGGLRRLKRGYWDLTAAALVLSPAPLLAAAYGGESVFRVYLFSLPFLAFFTAAAFFPAPQCGRSAFVFPILGAACILSAVGLLFANDGKDREYRFTPDEVAASEWLYSTAPPGSLLIEGARSYPSQFMNYENFSYLPISEESEGTKERIASDPEGVLGRWMRDPRWKDAYVILTRSQKAYLEAGGYMRRGDFERIENALLVSPRFIVVHATPNVKVFTLLKPKQGLAETPSARRD